MNILLTSLFLQKIQTFERFKLVNLLKIFLICKRGEWAFLSPVLSSSLHATSRQFTPPPLFLPHFTPLNFTSHFVCLTSCHLMSLHFHSVLSASLHATSLYFTSPPILSGSLRPAFCYFCLTLPNLTPLHLSHFVNLTSHHFTPFLFASRSLCIISPHFTSLHFTPLQLPFLFASLHLTLCHCFTSSPLSLPHFTPLHFTPTLSSSLHLTLCHYTLPPVLFTSLLLISCNFTSPPILLHQFTSLRATLLHLRFFLTHFTSFHATSLHITFCLPHCMPLRDTS